MSKKNTKNNRGFMMVEILIAASIIVVSVLASMAVAQKSISLSNRSVHTAQANFLLEEGAEAVRIIRDGNWENLSNLNTSLTYSLNFSGGMWALDAGGLPDQIGIFTRTVNLAAVNRDAGTQDISINGVEDAGTRLITITISWPEGGQTISKTLPFYISDIFS